MYTEEFCDKTRRIIEDACNEGHIDALDEIFAPDFVRHQPPFPGIVGLEAYKQYVASTRRTADSENARGVAARAGGMRPVDLVRDSCSGEESDRPRA